MKTNFKTFLENDDTVEIWKRRLRSVVSARGEAHEQSYPSGVFSDATRFIDKHAMKNIIMTELLKRVKNATADDDYGSILNIIDQIRYAAIEHPELKYPELSTIEKSARAASDSRKY